MNTMIGLKKQKIIYLNSMNKNTSAFSILLSYIPLSHDVREGCFCVKGEFGNDGLFNLQILHIIFISESYLVGTLDL